MKIFHYIFRLCLAAAVFLIMGCEKDTLPLTTAQLNVVMPSNVKKMSVVSEKTILRNLASGVETTIDRHATIDIPEGLYDCIYTADVMFSNGEGSEARQTKGYLQGKAENVEIRGKDAYVTIETFLSVGNDDFIFEEIFFSGTLRPSGSQYYGDGYIKIYNNTDHVLYADRLAFCESKFKSVRWYDYRPDIRQDTMTVQSIYVIPGMGTDHPVLPGHAMIICDTGMDHRVANTNSFDLSQADFEWYDESSVPSHLDIDTPTPNLDKWYCYTQSFYVMHNRGFTSFALVRVPKTIDKEQYLKKFLYEYNYTMHTQGGDFYMTQKAYKIPNTWIVDGVNCSVEANRLWNILPPSIDAGWTHVGFTEHDKSRYFRSIRRKLQYLNADGTMHLQDTNNSTDDFNTECVPSLIEMQGTAIDATGKVSSGITYDGVKPMTR